MRGLILAAGRGSRLGDLTDRQPKCLTVLHGRTLLQWQLAALAAAGIDEIAVVRGYLGETLPPGLHYFENPRWAGTNMVRSLMSASAWLAEDMTLISYADIVYSAACVAELLAATPVELAIACDPHWRELWSLRFDDPLADAETFITDADGYLRDIGRRTRDYRDIQGQYMGLLRVTPGGWRQIRKHLEQAPAAEVDSMDMTTLLRRLLGEGMRILAVPVPGPWYEVDNVSDLRLYETLPAVPGP